ncbi:hypothetical protein MTO96_049902, partial [Rhipicephalus appendiculatus]
TSWNFSSSDHPQRATDDDDSPATVLLESLCRMRQVDLTHDNLPEEERNEPPADVNGGRAQQQDDAEYFVTDVPLQYSPSAPVSTVYTPSAMPGPAAKKTGKWTQILGVFASKGNVKAPILSKILLEATILSEKAGLFVDFWTSDGAPWNQSLWNIFGIKASSKEIVCQVQHPVHPTRGLHFISDFPHLVK